MTVTGVPTKLGHVALRVRDLDRAVAFYRDVVGLPVKAQYARVAFLGSRADASHEIALFALDEDAPGPEANLVGPGSASPLGPGLYHLAWEMASFQDLERFHERLLAHNTPITGYSDRQSNVMFLDPDGNENEALWEPSPEEQQRLAAAGGLPRLKH